MTEEDKMYLALKYDAYMPTTIEQFRVFFYRLPDDFTQKDFETIHYDSKTNDFNCNNRVAVRYNFDEIYNIIMLRLFNYDRRRETVSSTEA